MQKLNVKEVTDCDRFEIGQILDTITTAIRVIDTDYNIVRFNRPFEELCGHSRDSISGRKCYDVFPGDHCQTESCPLRLITIQGKTAVEQEIVKLKADGSHVECRLTAGPQLNQDGKSVGIIEEFVDITTHRRIEEEIHLANQTILVESQTVETKNIALKELLNQIEHEKRQLAAQVQSNVDRIILPLVHSLRDNAAPLDTKRISLIESQLDELVDPFISTLERRFSSLTPRETQICNLIKQSLSSKEIATLLHTSEGTVEQQRKKIRRKLGLTKTNTNLTTFLKTT